MSQIVDYGDPSMEMLSIFLRLLEKLIAESSWAAEDTIFQATAYAVPVLLEHVGDRRAPGRYQAIVLLSDLIRGDEAALLELLGRDSAEWVLATACMVAGTADRPGDTALLARYAGCSPILSRRCGRRAAMAYAWLTPRPGRAVIDPSDAQARYSPRSLPDASALRCAADVLDHVYAHAAENARLACRAVTMRNRRVCANECYVAARCTVRRRWHPNRGVLSSCRRRVG